jgi:voltage-gated potassium channel
MQTWKYWLDRELNVNSWRRHGLSPVNKAIVGVILLSVLLFAAETERSLERHYSEAFWAANLIILLLFAAEFALRIWSAGEAEGVRGLHARARYAGRGWLFIDFLAFGPELALIALVAFGVPVPFSAAGLKAIRLLRLLKLARYFPTVRIVLDVLHSVRYELLVSAFCAVSLIYAAAVVIYYVEGDADPENFGSVLRSLWWSVVTLTTVGYGDTFPQTMMGKAVAGIIAIIGIGIIALPSGIIAGAFIETMRNRRNKGGDPPNANDGDRKT